MQKGFTLIELLVTLVLISVIAVIAIIALQPVELLRKAKDEENEANAGVLITAVERYIVANEKIPEISPISDSINCEEIIDGGPVFNLSVIDYELSDWFPERILETGKQLYLGTDWES